MDLPSGEPPKLKEIGSSRIIEMKNIKVSNIPWSKRIEVLMTGILEIEVSQDQQMPNMPQMTATGR